jgi:hypothetical protein
MAKQYIYPAINPIWMNPVTTFNPIYNNLPFDFQGPQKCYYQKALRGLPQTVQVLSDWVPEFKIYDGDTGFLVDTITGATPTSGILDQTFTLYEFTINWGDYPAGKYFVESHYTNDDPVLKIERSGLIQTADSFPQTVVVQYTNSVNEYSAIFSTGIVFNLVVEGNIEDYTPAFDDVIYNDQYYNTTKLHSTPRREFTFYVGSNRGFAGIPPYVADKLNWAFSCDQIQLDGVYYQNTNGSKWEVTRADQLSPNFIGLKINIIEVINRYLQTYQPGETPADAIQVVTRTKKYLSVSSNITIAGVFNDFSLITRIIIYNLGGDIFTVNASKTADGSDPIAPAYTTDGRAIEVWEISDPTEGVTTLYLLGLAGTNCNIVVEWDQLDAPEFVPSPAPKPFVKGTRYSYEEVNIGDFEIDWNIGTGVGNVGTKYEGCVLSGTNGTKDMNGLIEKGWDSSQPLTRDILVGNVDNLITQSANQVGDHYHLMFNSDKNGPDLTGETYVNHEKDVNIKRDYIMSTTNTVPTMGKTKSNNSSVQPMDISNRARVTVFFVCITD